MLFSFFFILLFTQYAFSTVDVIINSDASFDVVIQGDSSRWSLQSSVFSIRNNTQWFTYPQYASDNLLVLHATKQGTDNDFLGNYNYTQFEWTTQQSKIIVYVTTIKEYDDLSAILFEQYFPIGLQNTQNVFGDTSTTGVSEIITSFPSFDYNNSTRLNYLNYYGYDMTQSGIGFFGPQGDFIGSSPLILYDGSLTTAVLAPLENFITGLQSLSPHFNENLLTCGLNGKINEIPANFTHTSILVGGQGINNTFYQFGEILLSYYGKYRISNYANLSMRKLGYVTGNGAFYYYRLVEGTKNYEETMTAIRNAMEYNNIPIGIYEFDSWWYYRNYSGDGFTGLGGVLLWEPRPDVFPDGAQFLGTPLWLHNRYTDPYNWYRSKFDFIIEEGNDECCLPIDEKYFEYIFTKALSWGMEIYEQDWLGFVAMSMNITVQSVDKAHDWLAAMNTAALKLGVNVMYDSPISCEILQSVEFQSAQQGSAMMDYNPGNSQWKNGYSNLIFWAVGLVPWKDAFWTTEEQSGCEYYACIEPNSQLQAIVATLTAGPVTIGDKINSTNRTLIMQICTQNGTLLKPDKPLTLIDSVFQLNFENLEDIQISSTFTQIGEYRWYYILAANLSNSYKLLPSDLDTDSDFLVYEFRNGVSNVMHFDVNDPLIIPAMNIPPWTNETNGNCTYPPCGQLIDFRYYIADKITPISKGRIEAIKLDPKGVKIRCLGDYQENIFMQFIDPIGETVTANCTVNESQSLEILCFHGGCHCA